MVLEGLNNVEVRTLSLRDAVLAVKLELSGDDGVLTPAVEVEGSLSHDEGASIRDSGAGGKASSAILVEDTSGGVPVLVGVEDSARGSINGTGHLENTSGDEGVGTRGLGGATESVDGRREGINGIGVVEGLGTEDLEENTGSLEGSAVINVSIGLDNPDELLARVVEVELELVRRGGDGFTASELQDINPVFVRYLGELTTFISIEVDVVDVERSSNQVGSGDTITDDVNVAVLRSSVEAEVADIVEGQVDTNFVVLESNERESKTRVAAEPELKRDVEGVFRCALTDFVG